MRQGLSAARLSACHSRKMLETAALFIATLSLVFVVPLVGRALAMYYRVFKEIIKLNK